MFPRTSRLPPIIYFGVSLLLFGVWAQIACAHGMSEAEKLAIIEGGNLRYLWLGATHMLTGYDHLAFVFGIIFFLKNFRDIAKYVTAFTVGHSVTLIIATFKGVQLNYFLIDAIIGLSVSYIAFSNIDGFRKYLNMKPPNMMLMILGLGLIHGCGLSTRLQQLPLSEDNVGMLLNIISFNVGVELGQLSALALMLLLIGVWRKRHSFQAFSLLANYFLIIWGGYLFLMQMHGFAHTSKPEEFAVPAVVAESSDVVEVASVEMAGQPVEAKWSDPIMISLPASSDTEYKIIVGRGASIEYSWETDKGKLFFDFHGEPKNGKAGYFESYKKDTLDTDKGPFKAPFEGTHGWYWENSNPHPVLITLKLKGSYSLIDKR